MTFSRYPIAGYPGDSAGWDAQKAWMDSMKSRLPQSPATPAAPQPAASWRPSFLNTPRVDYPVSPYANQATGGRSLGGRGGGGGGMSSYSNMIAVPPEMSLGAGAYWPGHGAEFAAQQQAANMGIMAGHLMPDTRYPSQIAAGMARDAQRNSPQWRRAMGLPSNYAGGVSRGGSGGLAGDYQSAYDEARQENEARYRDILEGYQNRHDTALGYLGGAGAQEYADINERYDAQKAAGTQNLAGRGLGNSTLWNTMAMGVDRERTNDIGRLEERLRNQYLTYDTGLSGDTLGFMERRSDTYPDYNQLAQLAQLQGQAGYGAAAANQPSAYQLSLSTAPGGGFVAAPMGGGYSGSSAASQARTDLAKANTAKKVAYLNNLKAQGYSDTQARKFWSIYGQNYI